MKVVCGIDLMDIIGNVVDLIMERLGRWRERLFMMKTMFPLTTADRFSAGRQVLGGVWTVSLKAHNVVESKTLCISGTWSGC